MADEPLVSSIDRVGPHDVLIKALPGEPLFPLRAHDQDAVPTVEFWVERRRTRAFREPNPEKAKEMLEQAAHAEVVAWAMLDWRKGEPEPDAPQLALYSGHELSEEAKAAEDRVAMLSKIVQRLHNSVAELADAADALAALNEFRGARESLRVYSDAVKALAYEIEPKRPGLERRPRNG